MYMLIRHFRRTHKEPPGFLPERLKQRWQAWAPGSYMATPNAARDQRANEREARRSARHRGGVGAGVDRVSSVRSIMTLPEYRPTEDPTRERTIGREGERGGIDVVVEYPEDEEEEESRREEHMQTLYEIRLARQLERAAERERENGGGGAAAATAAGGRGRSGSGSGGGAGGSGGSRPGSAAAAGAPASSTANLMAALAAVTERERRMSSVSYASVGVARHDGSRVRPSTDSDRPLIDGAVRPAGHSRTGSTLSLAASDGRTSDEMFNPNMPLVSPHQRPGTSQGSVRSMLYPDAANGSTSAIDMPDTPPAWHDLPPPDTADYGGSEWGPPPGYTSPVETRNTGPDSLPVLRINTATPASSVAPSPVPASSPAR